MGNFRGARPPLGQGVPVTAIDDQIYAAFGTELVTLTAPSGRGTIAMKVETGTFRLKNGAGDTDDDLAAPTATDVSAGNQSLQLKTTDGIVYMSMPDVLTVQGEAGSDILTFWFLP
jgi:hypothetical protein